MPISADADGPRDAASRPIDHHAVHKAGRAEWDQHATIVRRCWKHSAVIRSTRCSVVYTDVTGHGRCGQQRSPFTALLTALNFGRHVVAKFFEVYSCAGKNGSRELYHARLGANLSSLCHELLRSTSVPNMKFISSPVMQRHTKTT